MDAKLFHSHFSKPPHVTIITPNFPKITKNLTLGIRSIKSSSSDSSGSDTGNGNIVGQQVPGSITRPDTVEIRFRRRSKRKSRREGEDGLVGEGRSKNVQAINSEVPPKKWEDMSFAEKAIELYVGEKGLLFWLNKFAYASIFIVIGGWILFRFVGPSLNLYQLDSPPLSPTSIFKG